MDDEVDDAIARRRTEDWTVDLRRLKGELGACEAQGIASSGNQEQCNLTLILQSGCTIFKVHQQDMFEEEWETAALIFRLSCTCLAAALPSAEGYVSSTYSLVSEVATMLESAWKVTWGEGMTAVLNDGFTAVATGLVALKELVTIGHIQQDQASCLLQAFGACLRVAHRALFCPRWLSAAGSEGFQKHAHHMRTALKETIGALFAGVVRHGCSDGREERAGGIDKAHDIDESLSSTFEDLLQIGRTASDVIAGKSELTKHTEFRSFATLNVACSSLSEAALAIGGLEKHSMPLTEASIGALLEMLCSSTCTSFKDLAASLDAVHIKVLKFWVQHVTRVMGSSAAVTRHCWQPVAEMLASCLIQLPPWQPGSREESEKKLLAEANAVIVKASAAFYSRMCSCNAFQGAVEWAAAGASELSLHRSAFLLEMLRRTGGPEGQHVHDLKQATYYVVPAIVRSMGMCLPSPDAWQALVELCAESLHRLYKIRDASAGHPNAGSWNECQAWLCTQAMQATPLQAYLLSDVWSCLIRGVDANTAAEHIGLLHKACLNVACLEAQSAQQGRPCDTSLQPQLRSLTATLLRSVHPELMTFLCSSIIQDALTLHSSMPLAADTMAGLAAAANTIAAVAAAGVRADQEGCMLSVDAYERPALECLRVLCRQVCSAAGSCGEAAVEATACCLCSVLRMCAELRYHIDDKAAQHLSEAVTAVLCCTDSAAWAPALAAADILYRLHPADLEATITAFAQDLGSKPSARLGCAALLRHAAGFSGRPCQLFAEVLKDGHWAVQHEAMQSFVGYTRSPSSEDFREVIPKELLPDPSHPEGGPFVQLTVQYLNRSTPLADPGCLAATKQQEPYQWSTDGAVKVVLEQGACSRTAQLEHLAKQVKLPTTQKHVRGAGSRVTQTACTAKEALAALCNEVRAGDGGRLTSELKSQLDEMACIMRNITASAGLNAGPQLDQQVC